MSRRTQAAIAVGVLAFSTGGVPVAVASDPDQTGEGTSAPAERGGGESATDPDAGSGDGEETGDPSEVPAAPADPGLGEGSPAELVPVAEPNVPAEGDDSTPPAGDDPAEAGDQAPVTPAPVGGVEPAAAEGAAPQADSQTGPQADSGESRRDHAAADPAAPLAPRAVAPAAASPAVTFVTVQAATTTVRVVSGADSGRALPGDRFHVVSAGESLWSIATDRLGDRASPERVARAVNGMWELNRDRIGTGDRDLLLVGTQLRLR